MNIHDDFYGAFLPVEEGSGLLSEEERLDSAAFSLVRWYQGNKRKLPWRDDPTPYHVWLSEIMLQQTRVEAVIPYYHRFLERLPQIRDLAEVPDEDLMKLWQGLGYYNRARNLKKAAQAAVAKYEGNLPGTFEELLAMPGIGPYTAGAVASIALKLPEPAVDGNVLRVLSRLWASEEDIGQPAVRKKMEEMIRRLLRKYSVGNQSADMKSVNEGSSYVRPDVYNQALMELGALVCIPNGSPRCGECPWEGICLAHQNNVTDRIPYKAPKKARKTEQRTVLLIRSGSQVFLRKRPAKGLLANLYELPNVTGWLSEEEVRKAAKTILLESEGDILQEAAESYRLSVKPLKDGKHIFSHVEWHMKGYEIILEASHPEGAMKDRLREDELMENGAVEDGLMKDGAVVQNAKMVKEAISSYTAAEKGAFYELSYIKEHLAIPSAFSCFPLEKKSEDCE